MKTTVRSCQGIIAAGLYLFCAAMVQAHEAPQQLPPASKPSADMEQVLYKGVVGNLLEAVPMDSERRVQLQRTNAVVSGVSTARTLAMLLGAVNPVFMIGGLVWGLYSASQIKAPEVATQPVELAKGPPQGLCVDTDAAEVEPVNVVLN